MLTVTAAFRECVACVFGSQQLAWFFRRRQSFRPLPCLDIGHICWITMRDLWFVCQQRLAGPLLVGVYRDMCRVWSTFLSQDACTKHLIVPSPFPCPQLHEAQGPAPGLRRARGAAAVPLHSRALLPQDPQAAALRVQLVCFWGGVHGPNARACVRASVAGAAAMFRRILPPGLMVLGSLVARVLCEQSGQVALSRYHARLSRCTLCSRLLMDESLSGVCAHETCGYGFSYAEPRFLTAQRAGVGVFSQVQPATLRQGPCAA